MNSGSKRRRTRRFLHRAPLGLVLLGSAIPSVYTPRMFAQATASGSVTGFVLDPDQAAIPGATLTLTPTGGAPRTATSGSDGGYAFRNVPAGTYSLTVTMPGFASFVRQNLRVAGTGITLNTSMAVQAQSQEVNVTAESTTRVSVDPDNNGSSVVIKDKDLEALSDDPDELSSELSALAGPAAGPNGGQIYVDGFTGGQLPPKSSIREIRVNQNPFSAQFDKQGFGRVEVFTKPGTDSYHGNASIQGNDKAFNTSSPFLGPTNQQPDYHRIFFLGSLTGPLTKKSSYSVAGSDRIIQDNSIFAGQIISTGPTSAVLCAPGNAACSLNTYPDASRAVFHPQHRYDFTPRIDLALGASNTLTVRYQLEHNDQQNAGLGSTGLPTVGYNTNQRENQVQISDTQIISAKIINETRLALTRAVTSQSPLTTAPTVSLPGYFSGGGSSAGTANATNDHLELQNYTSVALAKNFIRAGMRLRIYREAQLNTGGSNGVFTYQSAAAYIANKPFQYRITSIANPKASANLSDVGLYAEDDWRAKPNLTVSYGVRYEAQSDIHSNADIAPRFSVSYGIKRKTGNPLTVIRAGWGVFYDRFNIGDVLNTYEQNGINQITNIYRNPTGICQPGNTTGCGTGAATSQTIYQLASNLRSSYNMQTALGVDQQVGKRTTISINYLNTQGVHQFLSRALPTTGTNLVYQYQSGGVYRQNQFIVNFRTQVSTRLSLFGFYALNYANSNANGADSFPTDSTNSHTDYGRALFAQRHRIFMFGNYQAPFGLNFSPFLSVNSGSFYNITTGTDVNNDSIINDRAAFANGVSGSCTNALAFTTPPTGTYELHACAGGLLHRAVQCSVQPAVLSRCSASASGATPAGRGGGADAQAGGGARPPGGGGGPRGGGGGGGGRGGGFGGGINSGHKYNFNVGAQIQNVFNYVPYSTPNGPVDLLQRRPLEESLRQVSGAVRRRAPAAVLPRYGPSPCS